MTRYISTSVALCYDAQYREVVKVVRHLDSQGRRWEEDANGTPVLLDTEIRKPPRAKRKGRIAR